MQYEGSEGDDDVILRVHYRIKGEGCGYQLLMYDFPDDDFGKEGFLPFAAPDYWDGPTFATPGEAIDFRIEQGDWECVCELTPSCRRFCCRYAVSAASEYRTHRAAAD